MLEVLSRLPRRDRVSHSGVEDLSGPCRGSSKDRRQSSGSVQHVVVNYPTVEYESIHSEPTITQQRSTARGGVRGVVNYHKMALEDRSL